MSLLHRIVLNDVISPLAELFPPARVWPSSIAMTRLQVRRHNKQLMEIPIGTETLRRSLFGFVKIYNLLPQQIIDKKSVQLFQPALQRALCLAACQNVRYWEFIFSFRLRPVGDSRFH